MKRLISMLIVAVMIVATFVAAIPVSAAGVDEVYAPYFDVKPTIDGIVSTEEWGPATVVVDQKKASNAEDPKSNTKFFLRNSNPAPGPGYDSQNLTMHYEMWLRWDENYFYVAVKVTDPDGHSLKNGRNELWNGDGLQFRVDPFGSSYYVDTYEPTTAGAFPWSSDGIDDLCFGFVESAGGFTEAWNNTTNVGISTFRGGTCLAEVVPAGADYSGDSKKGITTYEIAVPWKYIDTNTQDHSYANYDDFTEKGGIWREYGMSAVVYNADGNSGTNKWNAALAWGSGIIKEQQTKYSSSCTGSNNVVLDELKVSELEQYNSNYAKGTGYKPPVKDVVYPFEIDETLHVGPITYDSEDDLDLFGLFVNGERAQDTDGNWVIRWDEDNTESGNNEQNYLSTHGTLDDGSDAPYMSTGNYTMEFDIKITDFRTIAEGYPQTVYNWFGGSSTVDYECGYYFKDQKFEIVETTSRKTVAEKPGTFAPNEWHHWVFQYFKDNQEVRLYVDPKMENGMVSKDAEPLFKMSYRYFDMPGVEKCGLIFRRLNCQIMMDNVQFYNFVDFTQTGQKTGETTELVWVDETNEYDVDYTVTQNTEDGTIALGVPNKDEYKLSEETAYVTAVKFNLNFKDAADKAAFKKIEGLAEDDYEITENEDGTLTMNIKRLAVFKEAEEGKPVFSVIIEPVAGTVLTEEQVKEIVKIKSIVTKTYLTGDEVLLYVGIALAIVAALGAGIVIVVKRRRRIEF